MKKYREQICKHLSQTTSKKKNIIEIILDIAYLILIIPLLIITIIIIYQSITKPDEVPNVFGYKMFIILDEKMEETLKYGDLVFTKNINTDDLRKDNIIAFRNGINTITIHKIDRVTIDEEKKSKIFEMNTGQYEAIDSKYVKENTVEGLIVKRIPKIGLFIITFQKPLVLVTVIIFVLIIGLIAYYIAQQLDERDRKNIEIQKEENIKKVKQLAIK